MKNSTSKNVRVMQRVPHVHNQRIVHNDRYWCDVCFFAWPRSKFYANGKSPFSKESRFRAQTAFLNGKEYTDESEVKKALKEFLVGDKLNALKVPELVEKVRQHRPDIKGASKMRKADLVAALLES